MPRMRKNYRRPRRHRKIGLSKRLSQLERKVNNNTEVKTAILNGSTTFTKDIYATNLIDFLPEVPQGTKDGERIGSKITLKSIHIRGYMMYDPTDVNGRSSLNERAIGVRSLILAQRDQGSAAGIQVAANFQNTELLENGSGFNSSNKFANFVTPLNKNLFTSRMDKRYKLFQAVDGPDTNADPEVNPYNVRSFTKKMTFGKGKELNYLRDTGIVAPVNWKYVWTMGYVNLNNTVAIANKLMCNYSITMKYTDK